jgi:hypothetical protein
MYFRAIDRIQEELRVSRVRGSRKIREQIGSVVSAFSVVYALSSPLMVTCWTGSGYEKARRSSWRHDPLKKNSDIHTHRAIGFPPSCLMARCLIDEGAWM